MLRITKKKTNELQQGEQTTIIFWRFFLQTASELENLQTFNDKMKMKTELLWNLINLLSNNSLGGRLPA